VAVKGANLEEVIQLTEQLSRMGLKDMVIDSGSRALKQAFEDQVFIRRGALSKIRSLGYPTMVLPCEMTDDPMKEALIASVFIAKYAGILVMSDFLAKPSSLCCREDEYLYRPSEALSYQGGYLRDWWT